MRQRVRQLVTHLLALVAGFAAGLSFHTLSTSPRVSSDWRTIVVPEKGAVGFSTDAWLKSDIALPDIRKIARRTLLQRATIARGR
jgi:hypothetical protein